MVNRQKYGDVRVFHAMQEARRTDTSFTDRGFLNMFPPKYKQHEVRDIWFKAMALGMEEGLRMGTLQGQKIDLFNNCKEHRHKEFLEKFYKLASDYNCAISYHPNEGICVIDLKNDYMSK